MSLMTVIWFLIGFLLLLIALFTFLAFFDWRAFMIRRVGPDYRKGLAHIEINGVWVYRESALIFEGTDAMTYSREVKVGGIKFFVNDIVPNELGFSYDEYTGARIYRVMPGGSIGYSDDGKAPAVDYPAELISVHVLDRTVSNYAASVNAGNEFNWKPLIIGGIVLIAVVVILFTTGIFKFPGSHQVTPAGTSNQTQIEQTIPAQGEMREMEGD